MSIPTQPLPRRADEDFEFLIAHFEEAWQTGVVPRLAEFLPPELGQGLLLLQELVRIDLEYRWRRPQSQVSTSAGDALPWHPLLEHYTEQFSDLGHAAGLPLSLVGEEYRVRRVWGDPPCHAEFAGRFPSLGANLETELARIDAELARVTGVRRIETDEGAAAVAGTSPTVPGYEILGELGRGGMGVVYEARQLQPRRVVALKMLRDAGHCRPDERNRFRAEAEAVARLQHPNIVQVYEVGEHEGCPYFVLEYVNGGTLAQGLGGVPQSPRQAAALLETLARAVEHAHQRGVIHRDLKPANILIADCGLRTADLKHPGTEHSRVDVFQSAIQNPQSAIKITDFGLAKQLDVEQGQTQTQALLGTPSYMAPEQAAGQSRAVGPAADIYALGVILYELLTGRPPFRADTPLTTLDQVRSQEPLSPSRLQPGVPRDLQTICLKCLEKEPNQRYTTAGDLAEDLGRYLGGLPVHARPVNTAGRLWRWTRRRPAVAALILLVVSATAGLIAQRYIAYVRLSAALDQSEGHRRVAEEQRTQAERNAERFQQQRDASWTIQQREGLRHAMQFLQHGSGRASEVRAAIGSVPEGRRGWEWQRVSLLLQRLPHPVRVLGQHDWGIAAMLLSHDGRFLITSGHDGRVIRWPSDGGEETEWEGGSWSNAYRRWRHLMAPIPGEEGEAWRLDCFMSLCWLENGVRAVGVSYDGRVVSWDVETGGRTVLFEHPRRTPWSVVAASPDGRELVTADQEGVLFHHDCLRGQWREVSGLRGSAVMGLGWLGSGRWAIAQASGMLHAVELPGFRVLDKDDVEGQIWDLAVAPDGERLAVASSRDVLMTYRLRTMPDGSVTLARFEEYSTPELLEGPVPALHVVRFTPDGQRLCAIDQAGRFLMWKNKSRLPVVVQDDQLGSGLKPDELALLPLRLQRRGVDVTWDGKQTILYTAGHDTLVKAWDVRAERGITRVGIGPKAQVRFDCAEPSLLWSTADDGSLSLWDTTPGERPERDRSDRRRSRVQAHRGPATGMDLAAQTGLVVTCGQDGTLAFWKRTGHEIQPDGAPLPCGRPLRCVAISRDASRVAAYEDANTVSLWEVASRRLLGRQSVGPAGERPALMGLVVFNHDATALAATGPKQTLEVFDGITLTPRGAVEILSGKGGTALLFHPTHAGQLVAGDTGGRVSHHPRLEKIIGAMFTPPEPVTGIAFSPGGERLAAVAESGKVLVVDCQWIGPAYTFQSEECPRFGLVTGLTFDPTGNRLAAIHENGLVEIWETDNASRPPLLTQTARSWKQRVLLSGNAAHDLLLRSQSIVLNEQDRVCVVAARLLDGPISTGPRSVIFGCESGDSFQEEEVRAIPVLNAANQHRLRESLALRLEPGRYLAAVGVQSRDPTKESYEGEILLLQRDRDQPGRWRDEPVGFPDNHGFGLTFLPGPPGRPGILHGQYDHFWLAHTWNGHEWSPTPIGRQGDAQGSRVVVGPDGHFHLLFNPVRFGRDVAPLTYVRGSATDGTLIRETPDTAYGAFGVGLTVSPDGFPVIVCRRPRKDGEHEWVLASRSNRGWHSEVLTFLPDDKTNVSSLIYDRQGRLYLTVRHHDGRVFLARRVNNKWDVELVAHEDMTEISGVREIQALVMLDSCQRPVVVTWCRSEHGWLRVYRPEQ